MDTIIDNLLARIADLCEDLRYALSKARDEKIIKEREQCQLIDNLTKQVDTLTSELDYLKKKTFIDIENSSTCQELNQSIQYFVNDNKYINAIKFIRAVCPSLGLKEAKDYVDKIRGANLD